MSFESLTDEKIQQLLKTPKRVTNPKARRGCGRESYERDHNVKSDDESEDFVLFTRQNKTVAENFSCGLRWIAPGSEGLILARYNGASHPHPNHLEGHTLQFVPHIHLTTERYLRANLKPEGFAEETTKYRTLEGALHELVGDLNVVGLDTRPDQPELFK
jgi:hypothetical protein